MDGGKNQAGQSFLLGDNGLIAIVQAYGHSRQPELPPQIIIQAWIGLLHPKVKGPSSSTEDGTCTRKFYRNLMRIDDVLFGKAGHQIDPLWERGAG